MTDIPWSRIITDSTFGFSFCRVILDTSGIPVDYEFIEVNRAYADMAAKNPEDFAGKRVTEIMPEIKSDPFDWIGFFGRVALGGNPTEFEEYSKPLDRWFHVSVTSPEPGYFCVFSFDITEKRKTEIALIASEELNRRYFDGAPDGIFITDSDGRYLRINPAAADMLGYEAGDLLGKSVEVTMPPELLDRGIRGFGELIEKGRLRRKTRLMRKNGERIDVYIDAVALPERQYMAFCKDITDFERLNREKERYFAAFQAMKHPVIFTAPDGTIIDVNSAFTDMYGYSRDEVIGKTPNILNPGKDVYANLGYSNEDYDGIFSSLWRAIGDRAVGSWEGTMINRKSDGSLVWVNLVANALYDENGALAGIFGMPIDITTSRELESRERVQLYRTIADLAELRDDETGNHMKRVGIFARLLAKAMGMNERQCAELELFAPMHDIGKVGILDSILRAPRALTTEEFAVMKTHTTLGHNIVRGKKGFEMAADITLCHHERFDGSGYPSGLKGTEIPRAAHITALVDVYDALRSRRPYKEPWTHQRAAEYVMNASGTQFDPALVAAFASLHERFARVWDELGE
jgi:PAS domain S-box-containing protein